MATKRRRSSGTWEFVIKNKALLPKPISLTFDDEKEGDEQVRRIEAMLAKGIVPEQFLEAKKSGRTLRSVIESYCKSQPITADDADTLRITAERLPADFRIEEVTYKWVEQWVTSLKREYNLSPSRVRKFAGALSRCFNWVVAHGDMLGNPIKSLPKGYASYTDEDAKALKRTGVGRVKTSEPRDRRLEPGEEERIRAVLAGGFKPANKQRPLTLEHRESMKLLFDMALESAMRLREMYSLEWKQVSLEKRTIFLDKTKNGDKRQVPISSPLLKLLTAYRKAGHNYEGRLFPWWNGSLDRDYLKNVTKVLSNQWMRIAEHAGCVDLHFHDLRHEATSRLYERTTLTDLQIASITGHKGFSMLRRYANLRGSGLAEKMW